MGPCTKQAVLYLAWARSSGWLHCPPVPGPPPACFKRSLAEPAPAPAPTGSRRHLVRTTSALAPWVVDRHDVKLGRELGGGSFGKVGRALLLCWGDLEKKHDMGLHSLHLPAVAGMWQALRACGRTGVSRGMASRTAGLGIQGGEGRRAAGGR